MRFAILHAIRIGVVGAAYAEIEIVLGVKRDSHRVDIPAGMAVILGPTADHHFLDIRFAGMLRVAKNRNFSVGNDVQPVRPPNHRHGSPECRLVPPERGGVFEAVTLRIVKDVNAPIVTERVKQTVRPVGDAVDVRQMHRQFAHDESGREHLHGRPDMTDGRWLDRRRHHRHQQTDHRRKPVQALSHRASLQNLKFAPP